MSENPPARARTLARRGRYAEAEELLGAVPQDADPVRLDLLARIHAQQRHLDRADECWARAEQLDPGNEEFAAGRRRIIEERSDRRRRPSRATVLWLAAGLVTVLALGLLIDIRTELGDTRKTMPPAGTPEPRPSASTSPTGGDVLAALRLRLPGVRVRRAPDEVSVTFEHGLFREGATLSAAGRKILRALGARLRPYANRVVVSLIGHTDDRDVPSDGAYAGNMELGTARAVAVREALRASSGIPTARFSVSSLGAVMPPFHGDDPATRQRNRTVSVRISRLQEVR